MNKPSYLFDASSIIRALKEIKLPPLGEQTLQWFTVYEVINTFWKEAYLLHTLDASEVDSLVNAFSNLIREMTMLEPRGLEQEIFRMAISKRITVYDASYVALAAEHGLTLVTEDQKLSRSVSDMVSVVSLDSLI